MTTQQTETAAQPLTRLSEDERLFRDSVYEFADREIRPLVREMDEHAKIDPALIAKLFDLGVMAIEIPDSYGGGGASFFHSVLAVDKKVFPREKTQLRKLRLFDEWAAAEAATTRAAMG